ncbi:hypothetical protein B0H14DRAFT_2607507 [Mycena olivaceomarginata]|nr:hypothetical protein B0H14DRAFT_2607507 [Mycena olivaceomarginata]
MPRQNTTAEARLNTITAYLTPALTLLDDLNDALGSSFVQPISVATLSLITAMQNVKRNKDECISIMENIHQILYAIVDLHIHSETIGSLHPVILDYIGKLHRIHTFVEAQQDTSKVKYFFRQSEMNTLLKECQSGLNQALEAFKIDIGIKNFKSIDEMKQKTEKMQHELLELISTLSDGTLSDGSSSPKIFYGREAELTHIIETLSKDSPRVAILGGGGMGKTSLARAVLHHPDIGTKFEHRYFVSAESATNSVELSALIGLHLGLNPGKDLTKPVVQYFSRKPPSLLILDNLETPWEPTQSRGGVEELLSLLTNVPHLALMITMRGAERPAKVAWTHPFLLPLNPLADEAAQQIFMDITDHHEEQEDVKQLLQFTDNMPLAVDLMAHVADYEGFTNVLARWQTEKTSLLSAGNDRSSNLDTSIRLSLTSPRITSGANDLLSLLSILPDGLSDIELLQSRLPIKDIRSCKATLLATSLAYIDNKKRLRSLMPIREHIRQFSFPSQFLMHPLRKHFYSLLNLYKKYNGAQLNSIVNGITLNLGNLQELLDLGLHPHDPDLSDTIECILNLNSFYRVTGRGFITLIDNIPAVLSRRSDHNWRYSSLQNFFCQPGIILYPVWNHLLHKAYLIARTSMIPDLRVGRFHMAAGYYYFDLSNTYMALELLQKALALSKSCGDTNTQCSILITIAGIMWTMGDVGTSQIHANEARRLANVSVNLYEEAQSLRSLAQCTTQLGDYRNSIVHLQRAKEILGNCGMLEGFVDSQIDMARAEVHLLKSEYTDARSVHSQILQYTGQDPLVNAWALVNIAEFDVMTGATEEAVQNNLAEAKTISAP